MWAIALLGLIVKFSEITLSLAYRERNHKTGNVHGGIYWYVKNGLGEKWKWYGGIWAVFLGIAMLMAPAVQTSSVTNVITENWDIPPVVIGIVMAVLMMLVIIGGLKSISKFAELVVPFMAIGYIGVSIVILALNASSLPSIFALIFKEAFTGTAAVGGFAGSTFIVALQAGLARGVYSNEAGTGTAPLAHSSATVNHPVKQGMWGIVEVFVDTIVVCTMTALVVLSTGAWQGGKINAALTSEAFGIAFGSAQVGAIFVTVVIVFFAFTTAVVNVYYGEVCMTALGLDRFNRLYRVLGCLASIVGSVGTLSTIWNLYDFFFGTCAMLNLFVLFAMRKKIWLLVQDYLARLKSGKWEKTCEETVKMIPELFPQE